jgi:hypothetical protein
LTRLPARIISTCGHRTLGGVCLILGLVDHLELVAMPEGLPYIEETQDIARLDVLPIVQVDEG